MSMLKPSKREFTQTLLMGIGAAAAAQTAHAQNAPVNQNATTTSNALEYVPYNCVPTSYNYSRSADQAFNIGCAATTDVSQVTFLLNLEYLEASFFSYAVNGYGLPVADLGGNAGTVKGGRKVNFLSSLISAYAQQMANDDRNHVETIRRAIIAAGLVPASAPNIALSTGFQYVFTQVPGFSGQTFDAFASDNNFLFASYFLKDLIVTAYRGVITTLQNRSYMDLMLGLMAAEAYHAATIRTALFNAGFGDATNAISYYRDSNDGSSGTASQGNDHGVGTAAAATIADTDSSSIVESRTVQQVSNVLYSAQFTLPIYLYGGEPSGLAGSGLFFPNGFSNPT